MENNFNNKSFKNNIDQIILQHSAVGIIMVDTSEKVIYWNQFALDLLCMEEEYLKDKDIKTLCSAEEWERLKEANVRQKGIVDHFETKIRRKDGTEFDIDVSISIYKDENDIVIGSIGVFRDISTRKQAEREIIEANKIRSDFVSMVSHELKTPITAIKGSLGIVLEGATGEINDEQKEFLDTAMKNLLRLDCLVNDVLDYQKLEMGRTKIILELNNLNELVLKMKDSYIKKAQEKSLDLNVMLADNLPEFLFDKIQIEKVIRNFMENALKFTEKGSISIIIIEKVGSVNVSVVDQGQGIKEEDINKLFKVFGQLSTGDKRKPGSTGMGLALAKYIVEKHGGNVWVTSKIGEGSSFSFSLPIKIVQE